jgi:hypothetical protein
VWTCDAAASGVVLPQTIWPDGWNGHGVEVYGYEMGVDGRYPLCSTDVAGVPQVCQMRSLNSDCYRDPQAGQIVVAMFVPMKGYNPNGCRGLCRVN